MIESDSFRVKVSGGGSYASAPTERHDKRFEVAHSLVEFGACMAHNIRPLQICSTVPLESIRAWQNEPRERATYYFLVGGELRRCSGRTQNKDMTPTYLCAHMRCTRGLHLSGKFVVNHSACAPQATAAPSNGAARTRSGGTRSALLTVTRGSPAQYLGALCMVCFGGRLGLGVLFFFSWPCLLRSG